MRTPWRVRRLPHILEHRAQKWEAALRLKRSGTKKLERDAGLRLNAARFKSRASYACSVGGGSS